LGLPFISALRSAGLRTPVVARTRARPALAEFSDVSIAIASAMPPGFEAFEPEHQASIAERLMQVSGAWIVIDLVRTFAPCVQCGSNPRVMLAASIHSLRRQHD
jgi:hypothetical protein